MTLTERLDRLAVVGNGRLGLVTPKGVIDPLVGDPYASEFRATVLAELRAAVAEEREACARVADAVAAENPYDEDRDSYDPVASAQNERAATAEEIAAMIRARTE